MKQKFSEWYEVRLDETYWGDIYTALQSAFTGRIMDDVDILKNLVTYYKDLGDGDPVSLAKKTYQQSREMGYILSDHDGPGGSKRSFLDHRFLKPDTPEFHQQHAAKVRQAYQDDMPYSRIPANALKVSNLAVNADADAGNPYLAALKKFGFQDRDQAFDWAKQIRQAGHSAHGKGYRSVT